jgi:hypothetical protein
MEDAMAELTIDDIERSGRVRAVTDNFFFWQGRRFIALGPVLMIAAFTTNAAIDERIADGVLVAALAAAILVSAAMGRRYRSEFGRVSPLPGAHAARSWIKWLLVYPAMIASLAADLLYADRLPVFLSGFVWAAAVFLYRQSTGGGRAHYLVLAVSLEALGLAPLAAGITSRDMVAVMMLVLGAGFTVAALLDDAEMRAVMKGA